MQTITFPDGYTVQISPMGTVTIAKGGRKSSAVNATHWRDVPETATAEIAAIRKSGGDPADYLFANPANDATGQILRRGNGVAEAVAEAAARCRAAQAEREAKWAADRAAAAEAQSARVAASGMSAPVKINVEYFDGAPWKWTTPAGHPIDGRDCREIGASYYAEQASVTAADTAGAAASAAAAEAKSAEAAARSAEFAEKLAEARTTGQPVIIDRWVTDRCMCRSVDCSFDTATKYVLPDGTTKITYSCCY